MDKRFLTGKHFLQGNEACAEGAIAAGCKYAAGYPITPATEVAERLAERLVEVSGVFIQMEDELGSMASVIGASWAGFKSMTATSGPGLSLMLENIGMAIGTETPCVIVNIQRGGPTTGIPSVELQGDVIQPKRGSHGEYETIAIAPASPQEMFDHTIWAFNMAEKFRTPVFVLGDAFVGHMREEIVIPGPEDVDIIDRRIPEIGIDPMKIKAYLDEDVAPMPIFGKGFKAHVTSSCHDEYGKRNVVDAFALDNFIRKLRNKILKHREEIIWVDGDYEGKDIALVSYGTVSRCAKAAVLEASDKGLSVGYLRMVTLWPFAEKQIRELAEKVKKIIVLENNMGQMYSYVKAEAAHKAEVYFLPPKILGELHEVDYIIDFIKEVK